MKNYQKDNLNIIGKTMGALAKFLLALTNLVRSGAIKKIPQAIKFAEQQFGKVTPLLKKQIEKVFNLMALTSFLVSVTIAAGGFWLYKNKDVMIDDAREKVVKEISEALPGIVKELIPDIPEIPSVTGGVIPDTKTNVPSTTGGVLPFK